MKPDSIWAICPDWEAFARFFGSLLRLCPFEPIGPTGRSKRFRPNLEASATLSFVSEAAPYSRNLAEEIGPL